MYTTSGGGFSDFGDPLLLFLSLLPIFLVLVLHPFTRFFRLPRDRLPVRIAGGSVSVREMAEPLAIKAGRLDLQKEEIGKNIAFEKYIEGKGA